MAKEKSIPGIHDCPITRAMGLVKSEAQRRVNRLQRERAVAASDMDAIRGPKLEVWSARMPAYAYTSLCPNEKYRR